MMMVDNLCNPKYARQTCISLDAGQQCCNEDRIKRVVKEPPKHVATTLPGSGDKLPNSVEMTSCQTNNADETNALAVI